MKEISLWFLGVVSTKISCCKVLTYQLMCELIIPTSMFSHPGHPLGHKEYYAISSSIPLGPLGFLLNFWAVDHFAL